MRHTPTSRPACSCGKRLGFTGDIDVSHGPECCTCPDGTRVHLDTCPATIPPAELAAAIRAAMAAHVCSDLCDPPVVVVAGHGGTPPEPDYIDDGVAVWEPALAIIRYDATSSRMDPTFRLDGRIVARGQLAQLRDAIDQALVVDAREYPDQPPSLGQLRDVPAAHQPRERPVLCCSCGRDTLEVHGVCGRCGPSTCVRCAP